MLKKLKTISQEIIHENPWWKLRHDRYEMPNGKESDYFFGVTPGSVMIVPVMPDGRIIMVVQYRYINQKQSTEFPCGGRKEGEDFSVAVTRELLEETGCTADEVIEVGRFQPSNGLLDDEMHVYLAHINQCGEVQPEEDEEFEVMYRRPDEIDEMIERGDIWCGETLAAWAMVRNKLIIKQ